MILGAMPGGRRLASAAVVLALTLPAIVPGRLAAETLSTALPRVAPGWKLELVAAAPQIRQPTAVACSPDGKVFVGEDPMDMSGPVDQPIDRILCFHPDGRMTVFAEHLSAVFGMRYLDGRLYVHHSPKFSVFKDEDGVGTERVDLIESDNPAPWGSSTRGKNQINDHIPSGFELAMDGFFYISVGDKGIYQEKGRDGSSLEMRLGGVMRMRPDGAQLEEYCSGFRNTLDVAMTAADEMFVYDNSDHLNLWPTAVGHVVDGGYYGYPYDYRTPRPYTLPMMKAYGGGAPTGALAYDEDALPPPYRGNLFLCDWGRRELLRMAVAPSGGTYKAATEERILDDEAGNFRPTGVAVSPDGLSFYVADWNFGGWRENLALGRLFKVTWQGQSQAAEKPAWYLPAATGRPFEASSEILVKGLSHPARSVRMAAQRRLVERGPAAISLLDAAVRDRSAPAYARWHALWTLDAIDGGTASRAALLTLLDDPDTSVRIQALRHFGNRRVSAAAKPIEPLLQDGDAQVRAHAAAALGRIGEPASIPALLRALEDQDRVARFEAFTALNRIGRRDSSAWGAIVAGLDSPSPRIREAVPFALRETYDEQLLGALMKLDLPSVDGKERPLAARQAVLEILTTLYRQPQPWDGGHWRTSPIGFTEESHDTAPYLPKTLEWPGTDLIDKCFVLALSDPALSSWMLHRLPEHPGSKIQEALRDLFHKSTDRTLQAEMLTRLGADGNAIDLVREVLEAEPKDVTLEIAALIAAPRNSDSFTRLQLAHRAESAGNAPEVRAKAIWALGKLHPPDAASTLSPLVHDENGQIRAAVAGALADLGNAGAIPPLITLLDDRDPEIRRKSIAALGELKAAPAVDRLTEAAREPETRLDAIAALARMPDPRAIGAYLDGLGEKSPALRESCAKAITALKPQAAALISARLQLAKTPPATAEALRKIFGNDFIAQSSDVSPERYDAFAQANAGDARHGKEIFADPNGVGCFRCHTVLGVGGDLGPDLTHIGANYPRAELVESVLYPSKKINGDYQQFTLEMKNGDTLFGSVRNETPAELTIVDAEGKKHPVTKSEIVKRTKSDLSPMPAGLQAGLSPQDFADLIAYLQTLK